MPNFVYFLMNDNVLVEHLSETLVELDSDSD